MVHSTFKELFSFPLYCNGEDLMTCDWSTHRDTHPKPLKSGGVHLSSFPIWLPSWCHGDLHNMEATLPSMVSFTYYGPNLIQIGFENTKLYQHCISFSVSSLVLGVL